jgi:hypothetical protein
MSLKVVAALTIAVTFWSQLAHASSLTNRDGRDFKVTVIEERATKDQVLKPSAALQGICLKGCVVRLNDSENDEYELQGSDVVSIEDGHLYYDGPPPSPVPKAGEVVEPSKPGTK